MSKTIDEKVVQMRFDNKQFESGVKTTMSSVDKLKQNLNFQGVAKGFDNISAAAGRVNMSPVSRGLEAISLKFSNMEVMAITALANITNSAVNAGKKIISALTIEPITTGFKEYELKMGSVQTIMAGTGETLEVVNRYLEELNKYSDQTIYSFSDMTTNIGKFTNSGVKLDTAVKAMKGISNEAALSGANANEAARAMYNFAQAISMGYVQLIDWKSIENANMATVDFKNELLKTAIALGTVTKAGDGMYKSGKNAYGLQAMFKDGLKDQWLTTEVLLDTLSKYSDETTELGKKAYAAAQDVKTLTQLYDTLKESAQSGWAQTWELIVGDFNEAKSLFSKLSDFIGGIISKSAEARNAFLGGVLNSNWDKLSKKIEEAGIELNSYEEEVKKVAIEHGAGIGNQIILYGSLGAAIKAGKIPVDVLREALVRLTGAASDLNKIKYNLLKGNKGDDVTQAQQALKKLGYDLGEFGDKLDGVDGLFGSVTESAVKAFQKANGLVEDGILGPKTLSALKKATTDTSKLSKEFQELMDGVTKLGGREMLIKTLENIVGRIKQVFEAIGTAWKKVFNPVNASQIQSVIEKIYNFSTYLKMNEDQMDKLSRTLQGLFSIFKIIKDVIGAGLNVVLGLLGKLTGNVNLNILDFTASIGDSIVRFREWAEQNNAIANFFQNVVTWISAAVTQVKEWGNAFINLPGVQKVISDLTTKFAEFKETGKNMIAGLTEGLEVGLTSIPELMTRIGNALLTAIRNVLGIHSPSTKGYDLGEQTGQGFYNGLKEFFARMDWGKIFAGVLSVGLVATLKSVGDALKRFAGLAEGTGDTLSGVGSVLSSFAKVIKKSAKPIKKIINNAAKVVNSFKKVLNSVSFNISAKAILELAKCLAILVASVVVLTLIDQDKLWSAVGVVAALSAILSGLALLAKGLAKSGGDYKAGAINSASIGGMLVALGVALLLMVATVKILGNMEPEKAEQAFIGLRHLLEAIAVVFVMFAIINIKKSAVQNIDKMGLTLLKISGALLIMALVVKIINTMTYNELLNGIVVIALFGGIIVGLMAATKLISGSKNVDRIGDTLLKISAVFVIMAAVVKILSGMEPADLDRGIKAISQFAAIIAGLMWATGVVKGGKNVAAIGDTILKIGGAIALMAVAAKIMGSMDNTDFVKGLIGVTAFGAIAVALMYFVKKIGPGEAMKASATIIAMSAAIAVMAVAALLLGFLDLGSLAKGVGAVAILGLVMAEMVKATKDVQDCKGNLIVMAVVIALMAAAVAGLSFIDPVSLAAATGALGILIGMFALLIYSTSKAQKATSSLIVMTIAVGLLAGILYLLGTLPNPAALLPAAGGLSILLIAVSAVLVLLSTFPISLPQALIGVVGLLALCVPLLAFVGILALMNDVKNATTNASALAILAGVLTLLLIPLTLVGALIVPALLGVAALLSMAVPLLVFVGILAIMEGIPNAMANATILIMLTAIMVDLLTQLAIIGPLALIGIAALTALTVLMGVMSGLVVAVGAIVELFPGIKTFVDTGISLLISLANGLGQIVGSFVGGIAEGLFGSLPKIAESLSLFMLGITPFLMGAKMIDPSSIEGVKALAEMLLIITGASLVDKLTSWLVGDSSLEDFAKKLVPFGEAMMEFSKSVKGIDAEAVTAAANAGKMMAEMADTIPNSGGLLGDFLGENDMDVFGGRMVVFGRSMKMFSDTVKGIDAEAVTAAANAGKMMTEMADSIPNSGGVLGAFLGENDIDMFGAKMAVFGNSLKMFSENVKGIDGDAVTAAANAGKMMTEMADTIPNTGGLLGDILGDNDIETFGKQLASFGEALAEFSSSVSGKIDPDATTLAVDISTKLADIAEKFAAKKTLSNATLLKDFGNDLQWLGYHLNEFGKYAKQIDTEAISSVVGMVDTIIDTIENMTGDVKGFGENLANLGKTGLTKFIESFEDGPAITKVKNAAIEMVETFIEAIKAKYTAFTTCAGEVIDRLVSGIKVNGHKFKNNLIIVTSEAITAMKNKYEDFKKVGKYFVDGFVDGIDANMYKAAAKARAMANKAAEAAAKALDERSPSKVGYRIGDYFGLGFVNALGDYGDKAALAGSTIGESAKSGLAKTVQKIAEFMNADLDIQPTIRPVLDLSDVAAGSKDLSNLANSWNGYVLSGAMSLATSSSRSMLTRSAGSDNGTLIDQVKELIKDVSGQSGSPINNTFNITGDNPKEIANEVSRIIQKQVERRGATYGYNRV